MTSLAEATPKTQLDSTRDFWNANPCDGQLTALERRRFRYGKAPAIPDTLETLARFQNVLEVGCGQGTDALTCCEKMAPEARYTGIDYSSESVASARQSATELTDRLQVAPQFRVGNAEALDLPSDQFDAVYSMGVLHHTPNTQAAIDEVYRVLQDGGTAMIFLYRLYSPRLLGCYALRALQSVLDRLTFQKGLLLRAARKLGTDSRLGTMLLEGFGVPVIRSYRRADLEQMFAAFSNVRIRPYAFRPENSWLRRLIERNLTFMWIIEATKPAGEPSA